MSGRWYGGDEWTTAERGKVQAHGVERKMAEGLPLEILRMAGDEYELRHRQSFDRIQERGGFGVSEVIMLLADALERERARSGRVGA